MTGSCKCCYVDGPLYNTQRCHVCVEAGCWYTGADEDGIYWIRGMDCPAYNRGFATPNDIPRLSPMEEGPVLVMISKKR